MTIHQVAPDQVDLNDDRALRGQRLENLARHLAETHRLARQSKAGPGLLDRLDDQAALLQQAYHYFVAASATELALSYAAEWLLDNFYLIQQAIRQIREDMPAGYYRQLPRLTDSALAGYPRIYDVAREIVNYSAIQLDLDRIKRFIRSYQSINPLTMGELWALPTMLRLIILEHLVRAVAKITRLTPPGRALSPLILQPEQLADEEVVANAITSLRLLGTLDWKEFFESVSQVEQTLRWDPAGVYRRMDFETRDRYRKVVEELAMATDQHEEEIASEAIRLAGSNRQGQTRRGSSTRHGHVGYYLLDRGRLELEARLEYIPPWFVRLRRWVFDHPTLIYLGSIGLLTLLFLLLVAGYTAKAGGSDWYGIAAVLLGLIPAVTAAVTVVNWVITQLIPPQVLPKMDFQKEGIPEECQTIVVIPALLTSLATVESLLQQLELHFLRNPDTHLYFGLLTDFADAPEEHTPDDEALIEKARSGIQGLNEKYQSQAGSCFYFFHRARTWNATEKTWMGWERKRGKLAEFNRLLRGDQVTSYIAQEGNLKLLPRLKYVITLDADTVLPRGSASQLVAAMGHPLNQAEFDPATGKIVAGYTVLQPRTEIKPSEANQSLFTQVFAGDTGLDLYTLAVSDVYQDLFKEAIYVGKGIYDVAAFEQSLAGRVPENSLLSHDLFEGIHGRAGLVTDVVLLEDYPPNYLVQVHRSHRWVRGDWQLLPWLWPRVPAAGGTRPNDLPVIARWKILDNLRRSLVAPGLLALFVAGWFWLPGSALAWTLIGLLLSATPLLTTFFSEVIRILAGEGSLRAALPAIRNATIRWLLALAFLPYEAALMLDAALTTLWRLFFSRRHLLQWTTAADTVRFLGRNVRAHVTWHKMIFSLLFAAVLVILIEWLNPAAFSAAMPLLLAWLFAPEIAYWISRPIRHTPAQLSAEQAQELRALARRTWLYFERFVDPESRWLPPDHFQESPRGLVAYRTSPTNIGLLLLSTLAAYDMGYVGMPTLALRLQDTFESMNQLERYRGHFLNWYDLHTLTPLPARYVSTVDSGNLAACLLALRQTCLVLPHNPVLRWQRWQGLLDTLAVLTEIVDGLIPAVGRPASDLQKRLMEHRQAIIAAKDKPALWSSLWARLAETEWPEIAGALAQLIKEEAANLEMAHLQSLRLWSERVRLHLQHTRRELNLLIPWLEWLDRPPLLFRQAEPGTALAAAWQGLQEALPLAPALKEVETACQAGLAHLAELQNLLGAAAASPDRVQEARVWCTNLAISLRAARRASRAVLNDYENLARQAEAYVEAMEFGFLFDEQRQVFHIGYNVDAGLLDQNYYDLLASEARIASLVAIAKNDIPQSHWLHLNRPLTQVNGTRALLSWSGTMFEYLMPRLLMRSYEGTLLNQTEQAATEYQMAYGRERSVPWGISESGYYRFDANQNYQYQAFGVPGLGFKRGLAENLVVTPYASLLALSIRPQAVWDNLQHLLKIGMLGHYGLYEAIDYTRSRLPLGQQQALIRSYMAHHQGMIMLALTNYLLEETMVNRFHADPRVQSVDLILQEQIPHKAPLDRPPEEMAPSRPVQPPVTATPWTVPVFTPVPQVHYLSNGRYGLLITNAGSGYSSWQETDLTRWRADTTRDDWGNWIYVQDRDSGRLWSAGYQPTAVTPQNQEVLFYPHKVEFRRQDEDISLAMEITVHPNDDIEIRRITLTNHGDRIRRLRLVSYGEVILTPQANDARHPAFNKLFIESEYLSEVNGLLFRRRPRSAEEEPLYLLHMLAVEQGYVTGAYESDRARFLGRGQTPRAPAALQPGGPGLSRTTGATLDPIMAIGQEIDLAAHATVRLAYLTLTAPSRPAILALARRYQAWPALGRAFDQARAQSELELRQLGLTMPELQRIQQLLSVIIYPSLALRAAPATLAENRKGQPGLWPYAISGDYPILLVRVSREEETALLGELLRAHTYWRNRKIKIDLVIVNQREAGYDQELRRQIQRLLAHTHSDLWLNQRGGIFLIRADQLSTTDQVLLNTAARVILAGDQGSLAGQVTGLLAPPVYLPALVPTRPPDEAAGATPPVPRPEGLLFDNGLGGFSPDGREYVIYLEPGQWAPLPWINVVANPEFGFMVSEAGSGYSWALNSGENRLTPWSNDPVIDPPGEALYLRDEETAEIWSPTPQPAAAPAPYLIRHGMGYSIFEHHSHGLKQRLRLFVAPDAPVKVIQLRLENTWQHQRRITATYYAAWVLGPNRETAQQYVIPEYDADHRALLARNPYNVEFGERLAFLTANKPLHGLTADRTEFLGRMGQLRHPAALERIGLASTVTAGVDPCGAIQLHVDLAPGQVEEVYFLIGEGADRAETMRLIEQYQAATNVETAWQKVQEFWEQVLGTIHAQTPEPAMNLLLNGWLLYQDLSCRIWGRSAFYQSSGAFGFRDQLQDVMALLHTAPEVAREQILRAARHQFEAGDVLHWWHPPSGRGVRTRISDDLLWLPFVTAHYVTTTADLSILKEKVPFLRGAPLEPKEEERYGHYETTAETYTLYEHCRRAIKRGATAGPHHLPLMGAGDWNDGMNRVGIEGRGESVWLGWFLHATLAQFADICEQMGDSGQAATYRQRAGELSQALEANAWDGQWYRRAYYDDGTPLGSASNDECQIDSIAQSWAVLSGAGDPERVQQALESVHERLVRCEDKLILLFTPPFDKTSHDPGYIKGYLPGIRENGGQYTHAALWTVWAVAELGQGDRAEALFRLLNPIYHADTPDKVARYKVEPYVIAADVYGVPPHTGRGGWTWYTGSGGWMYRLGVEAILGLRRQGDKLRLEPCIPREWPGYELTYRFEKTVYQVQVDNSAGVNRGIREIKLDGKKLPNLTIPLAHDGRRHTVRIVMG